MRMLRKLFLILLVGNNLNKMANLMFALCYFDAWVLGGGLEPFRRVLLFWQLASPKEKRKASNPLAQQLALKAP